MQLMVDDIENLRKHLNISKWIILGHSFGGDDVQANLTPQQRDSFNYWSAKVNNGDTSYFTRWKRASFLAIANVYNKKYAPFIAERLVQINSKVNNLVWYDLQKIKFNCAPQLSSFDKPVLFIQGKQDIVRESYADKAHNVLKNSKIVLLDHSVHYGWLDQKEKYINEVESFIAMNWK